MKKQKQGKKFGRERGQRKALLKALATALVFEEKIKTTETKAKALSKFAEKFITKSKKGDIPTRRLLARVFSETAVKKLIDEIGPRYKERQGGYTRIIKLGSRRSDSAKMAIIELVK